MKMTTLCYIEKNESYLMLHRIKKKNDENADKWIGIGGKFEAGETPEECALREIREETNLVPKILNYRGIVTFVSDLYGTEYMHLFTASDCVGKMNDSCDEGVLEWVPKKEVASLPLWEGDRLFLDLLNTTRPFFSLKLCYKGEHLVSAVLDRETLKLV